MKRIEEAKSELKPCTGKETIDETTKLLKELTKVMRKKGDMAKLWHDMWSVPARN